MRIHLIDYHEARDIHLIRALSRYYNYLIIIKW